MADEKKQKIKVLEGDKLPMYKGKAYYEEPSMLDKAKINAKDVTTKVYDEMLKVGRATGKPEKEPIPSDIADQLQTQKNEKAYQAYEKRRAAGEPYKKGGSVSSASKRADGCALRGKTRA